MDEWERRIITAANRRDRVVAILRAVWRAAWWLLPLALIFWAARNADESRRLVRERESRDLVEIRDGVRGLVRRLDECESGRSLDGVK